MHTPGATQPIAMPGSCSTTLCRGTCAEQTATHEKRKQLERNSLWVDKGLHCSEKCVCTFQIFGDEKIIKFRPFFIFRWVWHYKQRTAYPFRPLPALRLRDSNVVPEFSSRLVYSCTCLASTLQARAVRSAFAADGALEIRKVRSFSGPSAIIVNRSASLASFANRTYVAVWLPQMS